MSAFVGIVLGLAIPFGLNRVWLWYGASPKELADRRRAKWEKRQDAKR